MSKRMVTSVLALAALGIFAWQHVTNSSASTPAVPFDPSSNTSLSLIVEPDSGITPIIEQIQSAKHRVDLVMYELEDSEVEQALADDAARGVKVEVLLNGGYYGKPDDPNKNESAYDFLTAHGISVHWTPADFALTHQKTLIIDDTAIIMTGNMSPQYYGADRDFDVVDTDSADVSSIEATFENDWDNKIETANLATDLVWSPNSRNALLDLITTATTSLLVYNEEMNDPQITTALEHAATRGVDVKIVMTYASSWKKSFTALKAAGAHIETFSATAPTYIHAKMILSDGTRAFLGSENFSPTSLDDNRELGIIAVDPAIISQLEQTFITDWQTATPF